MKVRESALEEQGPAAPPRANGELVFEAPWQSRIFGLTLALLEAGEFVWVEFQSLLIEAIARHERAIGAAPGAALGAGPDATRSAYDYYGCWLEAFGKLATAKAWLDADRLDALERELRARPSGHDHAH